MELDFNTKDSEFDCYEEKYIKITNVALILLKLNFEPIISVSLVDNPYIHKINKKYRNIDRETDVISFAFTDGDENRSDLFQSGQMVVLGDIYISIDKAKEQADAYGHPLERELCFLFTHGLLHLLGYDHMKEEDEKVMFDLQEKILERR